MRKRLIAGVIVLLLIVAGIVGYNLYFKQKPEDLANDYRKDAARGAEQITTSMDKVYDSFDDYLIASTIPVRKLRNVDNIDEYRRRLLPVFDDTEVALDAARKRLKEAREAIKRMAPELTETPSATFLDDSDPIQETESAARKGKDYLKRVERYLGSYGDFVAYGREDLDLRRRELEIVSQNEVSPDASLEEITASVEAELEETRALLKVRQELEPARDAEKLADNSIEGINITIDYLEETAAALAALDPARLDAASAELLDESKRVGRRDSELIAELSSDSGLSEAARSLSKRADDLQDAIAVVGSEGKERDEPPRRRPNPIPAPSEPKQGGSDSEDDSIS